MNRLALCAGLSAALVIASTPAVAQSTASVPVSAGKTLYDGAGKKVGVIYRVSPEGDPQVILNGSMVTVPASTLSDVNGKITTSISKSDLNLIR